MKACHVDLYDGFGQIESSSLLAHGCSGPGEVQTSCRVLSSFMEVRIVDDGMRDMPVGVLCECVVGGQTVMSGYLDDAAVNIKVFKGGRLHAGGPLRWESDGALTFVNRKKCPDQDGRGRYLSPRGRNCDQPIPSHPGGPQFLACQTRAGMKPSKPYPCFMPVKRLRRKRSLNGTVVGNWL